MGAKVVAPGTADVAGRVVEFPELVTVELVTGAVGL